MSARCCPPLTAIGPRSSTPTEFRDNTMNKLLSALHRLPNSAAIVPTGFVGKT